MTPPATTPTEATLTPPGAAPTPPSRALTVLRIAAVRVRLVLVLLGVMFFVGFWPVLRIHRDRWLHVSRPVETGISTDTEYWCPMCPGVVSDWPSKCPVCNMALVRRKKGEAEPLPDGVLARMQLSPYRIQLAGVKTAPVEYRPLRRDVILVGTAQRSAANATVEVVAEALANDLPFLHVGLVVEASASSLPGHVPFRGKVVRIETGDSVERAMLVRMHFDDPERDLQVGSLMTARAEAPLAHVPWWRRSLVEECRNRAAVEALLQSLAPVSAATIPLDGSLETAIEHALLTQGVGLAVPASAIVDRGSRQLAFVESGPGMFDAVEVAVGPRCGDFVPVLRGLRLGQRVVAAGAFLLDAETSLNRDLSAAWFGATRSSDAPTPSVTPIAPSSAPTSGALSEADRLLAAKQRICPVTGEPLDAMGGAVRIDVAGRTVFICCKACAGPLRKEPAKYLDKLK